MTVQLHEGSLGTPRTARDASASPTAIRQLERELGIELHPLHEESMDPVLRRYFTVELRDDERGQHLLEELRHSPLIAAAYVKPQDALP